MHFRLDDEYDPNQKVVIDPVLEFSTYLAGIGRDFPAAIALDRNGAIWVTGYTRSHSFPTRKPLLESFQGGATDIFVAKYSPQQKKLLFSTFLGGSETDAAKAIALDRRGRAFIAGASSSPDFPIIKGAQEQMGGNGDAIIISLSSNGRRLLSSSFLGGSSSDDARGIGLGPDGSVVIGGMTESSDFPTYGALQNNMGGWDGFVAKFSPDCDQVQFSTYLGGNSRDAADALQVDQDGAIYVTGFTWSTDFPSVNAFQLHGTGYDAFVTKLSQDGDYLIYSTYLGGGAPESVGGMAVDGDGAVYVTGNTNSDDFPISNALQSDRGGSFWGDAFVSKVAPSGQELIYSTYLGGDDSDQGKGIAVDKYGTAYVVGGTNSADFPLHRPIRRIEQNRDAFVTRLSPDGGRLLYSTYIGGVALEYCNAVTVNDRGSAFLTGHTRSQDFPAVDPLQVEPGDFEWDGWVAIITDECCLKTHGSQSNLPADRTSVAELTTLVSRLFHSEASSGHDAAGDVNGDGEVNISDLTYMADYLFRGGPAPHYE